MTAKRVIIRMLIHTFFIIPPFAAIDRVDDEHNYPHNVRTWSLKLQAFAHTAKIGICIYPAVNNNERIKATTWRLRIILALTSPEGG